MPIKCEIVTQERMVFAGEVDIITLPGVEGVMGILPQHAPMLTVLNYGEVVIRQAGEESYFAIGGGFAEIQPDKVIVLADSAERSDEINFERAEKARRTAEEAMKGIGQDDPDTYAQIAASLQRAQLRVTVSSRRHEGSRRRMTIQSLTDEDDN